LTNLKVHDETYTTEHHHWEMLNSQIMRIWSLEMIKIKSILSPPDHIITGLLTSKEIKQVRNSGYGGRSYTIEKVREEIGEKLRLSHTSYRFPKGNSDCFQELQKIETIREEVSLLGKYQVTSNLKNIEIYFDFEHETQVGVKLLSQVAQEDIFLEKVSKFSLLFDELMRLHNQLQQL